MARRLGVVLPCLLTIAILPVAAGIGEGNGEIGFGFGMMDFDSNINAETGGRFEIRAPLQEGVNSLELSTVTALGETAVSVGDVERDTTPPSAERVDVDWGN